MSARRAPRPRTVSVGNGTQAEEHRVLAGGALTETDPPVGVSCAGVAA